MGLSINGNVLQCTTKWQVATSFMDTAWPLTVMAKQKLQWFASSSSSCFLQHGNVICFLKLLLVCIFRLSCFLLVRSLLARFQWLPPHAAAADQPREAMEWVASRGDAVAARPSGDLEAVVEATREQSGEKLKLKGFVQLCSPKCWRACRSSNVPVKMCAPRRDKIMWLKLTTRGCCSERPHHRPRLLAAASYIPRGHRNARVFLRLVGPHTTK